MAEMLCRWRFSAAHGPKKQILSPFQQKSLLQEITEISTLDVYALRFHFTNVPQYVPPSFEAFIVG